MGCGSSKTSESDLFEIKYERKKHNFILIKKKFKELYQGEEEEIEEACQKCNSEYEFHIMMKEITDEFPNLFTFGLSDEEIKDSMLYYISTYRLSKNNPIQIIQTYPNYRHDGSLVENLIYNTSKETIKKTIAYFDRFVGKVFNAFSLYLEDFDSTNFLVQNILEILLFDKTYEYYDSVVLRISEDQFKNENILYSIGKFISRKKNLRNIALGILNNRTINTNQNKVKGLEYIFNGIAESLTIINFSFIRLKSNIFEIDNASYQKILNSLSLFNLNSLCLINIFVEKEMEASFINSICKNNRLKILCLQLINLDINRYSELVQLFGKSSIVCLYFNLDVENTDSLVQSNLKIIKKNNPALELLVTDFYSWD